MAERARDAPGRKRGAGAARGLPPLGSRAKAAAVTRRRSTTTWNGVEVSDERDKDGRRPRRGGDVATRARARGSAARFFRRRASASSARTRSTTSTTRTSKLLGPFVPERGKILPRRISGTCATHQRELQTAIKRARQIALIPYVTRPDCRRGSLSPMEVILREHVENLGRRGEIVKVADGYARNYLLPRKLALAVTEANKRQIEREREVRRGARAEERRAPRRSRAAGSVEIEIARRVGENDTLYGSVTSADIADALEAKGFDIDKRRVQLAEPLKQLGDVKVP